MPHGELILLIFYKRWQMETSITQQLILMGDNCDLLFGPITETSRLNQEIIALLNTLSMTIEIIYLEGNHDFRLAHLFPNILVVARNEQPLMMNHGYQTIALLHGDVGGPLGYEFYTALIRNRPILYILNGINTLLGGAIIKWLSGDMQRKNHCKKIENFEIIARRHSKRKWIDRCDTVIEGHYHQNKSFDFDSYHYINLGAFACNERYYVVKSSQDRFILDEAMFHKEPK